MLPSLDHSVARLSKQVTSENCKTSLFKDGLASQEAKTSLFKSGLASVITNDFNLSVSPSKETAERSKSKSNLVETIEAA